MKPEPKVCEPDPVIAELHRIKDEHAKKFNYDVRALMADLRERQQTSGRTYVSFGKVPEQSATSDAASLPAKHN